MGGPKMYGGGDLKHINKSKLPNGYGRAIASMRDG